MAELETNLNNPEAATSPETTDPEETGAKTPANDPETDTAAELARLKLEMAKQKAALDKATKEAGDYRKQLRAKQTDEEAAAEQLRMEAEEKDKRLAELEKRFAVTEISKTVMARLGGDEATSTKIAEYLYGAADADGALVEIQKILTGREKALKLEYGRVPAPGVGSTEGPSITKAQLDAMSYKDRVGFATSHPDEYNRLMGRT